MDRASGRLLATSAEIIGGASLLLFGVFLFAGPVVAVQFAWNDGAALMWDAGLSVAFFVQHSVMVRRGFKDRLVRWIEPDFQAAVYAVSSGAMLGTAMLFWQQTDGWKLQAGEPAAWTLRALAVAAIAGFTWGVRALRHFDTFGRRPIEARIRGIRMRPEPLVIRGPYRRVRHPLYFFMLVLIWHRPVLTADRLLFDLLWTVWIVLGTRLEERDLVNEFGESYRSYQRRVPMLIPWRRPQLDSPSIRTPGFNP